MEGLHIQCMDRNTDWWGCLNGIDVVIHCAAYTEALEDNKQSKQDIYEVNSAATANLARQASKKVLSVLFF